MNLSYVIGPIIGFGAFLIGLGTMKNVLWRKNDIGKTQFRFDNLIEYLKLPFDFKNWKQSWGLLPDIPFTTRLKLLNLNWVIMMVIGLMISILLTKSKN